MSGRMLPYTFRASGQRQTAGFQVDKQKIAALYDFTNAEAERCVNLFESGHLGDVLDKLGISNNTAKTHLRHIIEKVGCRRRHNCCMARYATNTAWGEQSFDLCSSQI